MTWNSCIYEGQVIHNRAEPRKNKFTYSIYMTYLDLDEIPILAKKMWWFGYNSLRPCSFYEKDHLWFYPGTPELSFKERFSGFLNENGIETPQRVMLLTNLRVWGYVFNPVNFYFCFCNDKLYHIVAEVTNTFKEQKFYMIPIVESEGTHYHEEQKYFYISPFVDFDTKLKFYFQNPSETLRICIHSAQNDSKKVIVKTALVAQKKKMSSSNIYKMLILYPCITVQIVFRIHYQALLLFCKKVPFFSKKSIDNKMLDFSEEQKKIAKKAR